MKCNECETRKRCWKVWKYAAFKLSESYKQSLEHIAKLEREIETLCTTNRINTETIAKLTNNIIEELSHEENKN